MYCNSWPVSILKYLLLCLGHVTGLRDPRHYWEERACDTRLLPLHTVPEGAPATDPSGERGLDGEQPDQVCTVCASHLDRVGQALHEGGGRVGMCMCVCVRERERERERKRERIMN